jgi:hypothetical protein
MKGAKRVHVRSAGVRTNMYRRERPDGSVIYDAEWSLRELENEALPVLASLPSRWPLSDDERSKVGQFVGAQFVRGPSYKSWLDRQLDTLMVELHANPEAYPSPDADLSPAEAMLAAEDHFRSASFRIERMFSAARPCGVAICSMRWTLIEFTKARLATSDHPVAIWPLGAETRAPSPNEVDAGLLNTLEISFPVGRRHLLLMTWLDGGDTRRPVLGSARHASTANAFVIANADEQWFHADGDKPYCAKGRRSALSTELHGSYSHEMAARSPRRAQTRQLTQAEIEAPLSNDPLSAIRMRAPF